ncbi:hypothetical protein GTS_37390 [Gandjariella thermophila]|uniref:Uncharacterized protein n=1 Tax=Gandjariella thermophila TaxID=1931992 RepID=A0A4D4JCD1_9PSEU|nr:hypothetical protein GTS_37390 [Gandjariella thermophila]
MVGLYRLWLVALTLKVLGSSWDVSWHFRWLRDDFAPPHLLNSVGTVLVVALVVFHTYTGYGVDQRALRLMQWGTGIFLVAIPLDVINHRVNGLDITAWSPSHALLYLGTALMVAGAAVGWWRAAPLGRPRTALLGAFAFFFLENVLFPNQHQEYGVLELRSWDAGHPYAEPSLLAFAANQIGHPVDRVAVAHFALPVPDWVYPLWGVLAATLVLVVTRRLVDRQWAATAVAAGYVGYRCVVWAVLVGAGFPPSTVPFYLLAVGLAVDAVALAGLPGAVAPLTGAVVVTGAGYLALAGQAEWIAAPPVSEPSAAATAAVLALGWYGAEAWRTRRLRIQRAQRGFEGCPNPR